MRVPKLQLGNPANKALGNRSCVALDRCSRRDSTSCMPHMDVANVDIAGANICPCNRNFARREAGAWELAFKGSVALRFVFYKACSMH